jgi:hypothetical protein
VVEVHQVRHRQQAVHIALVATEDLRTRVVLVGIAIGWWGLVLVLWWVVVCCKDQKWFFGCELRCYMHSM